MVEKKISFEASMSELEIIVQRLEQGDLPLEEALAQFQKGIILSKTCQDTLQKAEENLTKIMNEAGEEVVFTDAGADEDGKNE